MQEPEGWVYLIGKVPSDPPAPIHLFPSPPGQETKADRLGPAPKKLPGQSELSPPTLSVSTHCPLAWVATACPSPHTHSTFTTSRPAFPGRAQNLPPEPSQPQ